MEDEFVSISEAEMRKREAYARDKFELWQVMEELKRHYGGDTNPPCPDCGSMEHFEC